MQAFDQPGVAAVYAAYPDSVRQHLLNVRQLIFDTAAATAGVGELEECLKWGEPAYLTPRSKSGSTLRLAWTPARPGHYALHFNCRTPLVEQIRTLFPGVFHCEGNRSLWFAPDDPLPLDALGYCIAMALTYHRRGKPLAQPAP